MESTKAHFKNIMYNTDTIESMKYVSMNNTGMKSVKNQLKNGVLDIDGIALIVNALQMTDCYITSGPEDFIYLLQALVRHQIGRVQIISRDYEPHFLACDLLFTNNTLKIVIIDSTPCKDGQGKRVAAKYYLLCVNALPNYKIKLFTNREQLQYDDHSCKLFSIAIAKQLSKNPFLEQNAVADDENSNIGYFPYYSLPSWLMRNVQSCKHLNEYLSRNPENAQLTNYLKKHCFHQMYKGELKLQNRAIFHKLQKWQQLSMNYDETVILKHLGIFLVKSLSTTKSIVPDWQLNISGTEVKIIIPLLTYLPLATEEPYPQQSTNFLHCKLPENDYNCQMMWDVYKVYLQKLNPVDKVWINGVTIKRDTSNIHLSGSIKQFQELHDTIKEYSINDLLAIGCSSILCCHLFIKMLKQLYN